MIVFLCIFAFFLDFQLIELLSNADLGPVAADGFRIILEEASDVMTADQHAIIRLMYRQRFFVTTQKQLLEGYNQASYGKLIKLFCEKCLIKKCELQRPGSPMAHLVTYWVTDLTSQPPIRHLDVRPCKVLNPQDAYLSLSNCLEIW